MSKYKVELTGINTSSLKAIDNFDVSLNLKLSTYAVPMTIGWSKRCRILL